MSILRARIALFAFPFLGLLMLDSSFWRALTVSMAFTIMGMVGFAWAAVSTAAVAIFALGAVHWALGGWPLS